jgi:hypothetical protein
MLAPGTAPSPDPCQAKPNQLGVVIASRPRKRARKLKENFQQSPGTAPGPSGRCGGFNLASCTASPKSITYISDELGSKPDAALSHHGAAALRAESVPGVRMWADRSRRRCGGLPNEAQFLRLAAVQRCTLHAAFRMPRAERTNAQVLRLEVVVDHADAVHRLDSAEDLRRHSMVWPTQRRLVRVRVNRDNGTG